MIFDYFNLNNAYRKAILSRAKETDWTNIRLRGGRDSSNVNQYPMTSLIQVVMYVSLFIGTYFRDPIMQFVMSEKISIRGLPGISEFIILLIVPFCLAPFVYLVYRFLKIDVPPVIINIGICILYGVMCQSVLSKGINLLSNILRKTFETLGQ